MFDVRRPVVRFGCAFVFALVVAETSLAQDPSDPPPRSDTITAPSQFLLCKGNAYALCYYSGPEQAPSGKRLPDLPCVLGEDGLVASCTCYAFEDGTSVNYVALPSILAPALRQATIEACNEDGSGCLNMVNRASCNAAPKLPHCKTAPACTALGNVAAGTGQTYYEKATLVSTFSLENAARYPISSTPCTDEPYGRYAGCMTAPCGEPYDKDGRRLVDCQCPTYVGPFQFGQSGDGLTCDLGGDNVWSAAYTTFPALLPTQAEAGD